MFSVNLKFWKELWLFIASLVVKVLLPFLPQSMQKIGEKLGPPRLTQDRQSPLHKHLFIPHLPCARHWGYGGKQNRKWPLISGREAVNKQILPNLGSDKHSLGLVEITSMGGTAKSIPGILGGEAAPSGRGGPEWPLRALYLLFAVGKEEWEDGKDRWLQMGSFWARAIWSLWPWETWESVTSWPFFWE